MKPWPHQAAAEAAVLDAINRGVRRILLCIPTGGGKTYTSARLIGHFLQQDRRVVFYTNRKMLLDQSSRVFDGFDLEHGIRAAGHGWDFEKLFQISSIQTERARSHKWTPHDADLAVVDEAHLNKAGTARSIMEHHVASGAHVLGLTATPIGLGDLYDELIVCGTPSELRDCGALVPCLHYAPDEPDLKHIGRIPIGDDLTESQNVKAIMVPGIFGRVYDHWKRLNPNAEPTLLFAPGVKESVWFAEQFRAKGVRSAHIDGKEVWIDGEFQPATQEIRDFILGESKKGQLPVITNRFVMREGIDAPWLRHGIFATVFGSLQSYIQSGGRLLRKCEGKTSICLQDHGGNWHRHGSLNADREWRLDYTASILAGMREERLRTKKEKEPFVCPQCTKVLATPKCVCGYEVKAGLRSRPVIQSDGTMKQMYGDIYKPRVEKERPDTEKIWQSIYYRARRTEMTFRQAEGLFCHENSYWPPKTLPLMPRDEMDWYKKVKDVPRERLR